MKKWVVVGTSGDMNGLLYVVEAEDERDACCKVSELHDTVFNVVKPPENLRPDYPDTFVLTTTDEYTDEEIREIVFYGELEGMWTVHAQELKENTYLQAVVCW